MALEGEYWTITAPAGTTFRLKDTLGLQYLARLLAEPGREIHVLDLVGGGRSHAGAVDGDAVIDHGDAGELLDEEARQKYRRRLEDLRETVAEAESFGDAARAGRAREEIEFLGAELGRAVGLGGRARRAGSAAERARSAVQRRIKNALARIADAAPDLAAVLGRTVKTGNFCVYRPDI
ncbi:MAG: transcriptional regulator, partial [Polyangia bacterium]